MAVGLGESMGTVKTVRRRTLGASSKPESLKKKLGKHCINLYAISIVLVCYSFILNYKVKNTFYYEIWK